MVVSAESTVEAGGRRVGGGGGVPRRQPQYRPPVSPMPMVPESEPPHETPPPSRSTRSRSTPHRENNSPSSPNFQESHPDHGTLSPTLPNKSLKPANAPQTVKMNSPSEKHLVKRRFHRHVTPWVVGVYPNVPYSVGWYVDQVLSGNTIRVINPANQTQVVQLHGVAAPAQGQAFFSESRDRLAAEIEHQTVYVVNTFDHLDGSFTGKVFLGSEYVNRTQISEGMAFYDAEQGIDTDLAEAEMAAQEAGHGIWGNPDLVSDYAYAE